MQDPQHLTKPDGNADQTPITFDMLYSTTIATTNIDLCLKNMNYT